MTEVGSSKRPRVLNAAALLAALSVGCYETTSLRMQVHSAATEDCAAMADRVFADAGYERGRPMTGMDFFYTPRIAPPSNAARHWGIGAWLSHDPPGTCAISLEALSEDSNPVAPTAHSGANGKYYESPSAGSAVATEYSGQRGEYYDAAVRDMAKRLETALAAPAH